jgi:TonB family protein
MKTIYILTTCTFLFFACKHKGDRIIDLDSINQKVDSTPEIYNPIETSADFVGGHSALYAFLNNNITYPESAINESIEGSVFVRFVVERNGAITNVSIIRGLHHDIDQACIKAINQMPKWIPGKQFDAPIRTEYYLPIKFSLATDISTKGFAIRPKDNYTHTLAIKLFPNPTDSWLNIELIGASDNVSFQIIDSQGKIIKTGLLNKDLKAINVSDLTKGFYIIKVTSEDLKTSITEKFIKN